MKHLSLVILSAALLLLSASSITAQDAEKSVPAPVEQPPHILFVMLDDVGLKDFSHQGARIPTPYSDELSSRPGAIKLNRYYVHPVCSPSRISMMTGKYSHLSGFGSGGVMLGPAPWTISDDTNTIPKALKPYGYYSAAVGKWHMGHNRFSETPVGHKWGFDEFAGIVHGGGGHYSKFVMSIDSFFAEDGYDYAFHDYQHAFSNGTWDHKLDVSHSTKTFTTDAERIIRQHAQRQQAEGKGIGEQDPLFAYVSYTAPHTPNQAEPEWIERCAHLKDHKRADHCALMVGLDDAIKNVTETALKELGDNLIVVVSTDNGGDYHHGSVNEPFRGNKISGFEGGVRGTAWVTDLSKGQKYLGSIQQQLNRDGYNGLMHIADWLPTFAGIAETVKPTQSRNVGPSSTTDVPLGFGHNMHRALQSDGQSPRTDAVGCLDDKINFVSYIKGDYKMMIGHFGPGGWSAEEVEGAPEPAFSVVEWIEHTLHEFEDWYHETRDATIMWKEMTSMILRTIIELSQGNADYYFADRQLLGDRDSFMHGEVPFEEIRVALFDLSVDPSETNDLNSNDTTKAGVQSVIADMIQSFEPHWRERPAQFNSAMTCFSKDRLKAFPLEFCDKALNRTRIPGAPETRSVLMKNSASSTHASDDHWYQQTVIGTIDRCRFEYPFIADDDERTCGHVMSAPINLKHLYRDTIAQNVILPFVLCFLLFIVLPMVIIFYKVVRSVCCGSKKAQADAKKKKN